MVRGGRQDVIAAPNGSPPAAGARSEVTTDPLSFGLAIACLIIVSVNLRPGIVSVGPLLPDIQRAFGLSHTSVSLLIAIPDVLMGALALPAPWIARRFGRDRVILGALLLLLGSTIMRAIAGSPAGLLVATAGVGAGIAVAGALMASFVKARFPGKTSIALGLYAACLGVGSTLAAALTGPLAEWAQNWRVGAGAWAVPCILAVAAWVIVDRQGQASGSERTATVHHRLPFAIPVVWFIGGYFAFNNFIFYALLAALVPIYNEQGLSITQAGFVLAALAGGATVGSIFFGLLSRAGSIGEAIWRRAPDWF